MAAAAYSPVGLYRAFHGNYFRFRIERPAGFLFMSGQFIMVGLMVDGKPLMRAYSMANPHWDEELEFYSIIVPDGALLSASASKLAMKLRSVQKLLGLLR